MVNVPTGGPTLLVLTAVGGGAAFDLSPYSARGLTQTLEQINGSAIGSQLERDVNGNLMDLTYPQFQKYLVVITCRDVDAPALDGAWVGQEIMVACASELNFLTASGTPQRPVVSGSERTEGLFTFYRPLLDCRVSEFKNAFAEYDAEYNWQITLEEI